MNKILIILLVVCQLAHAQKDSLRLSSDSIALVSSLSENMQLESMTIMSPNAYAFARYGDVPVDYSTGKTTVSKVRVVFRTTIKNVQEASHFIRGSPLLMS